MSIHTSYIECLGSHICCNLPVDDEVVMTLMFN